MKDMMKSCGLARLYINKANGADDRRLRLLAGPVIDLALYQTGASSFQVIATASAVALAAAMVAVAMPSEPRS